MLEIKVGDVIEFDYYNWKGMKGRRKTTVKGLFYGSTEYHPENQWLLKAYDMDKHDNRLFALKDVSNVKYW